MDSLLQEFVYKIVHCSGKQMKHIDAIRRPPVNVVTNDEKTHNVVKEKDTQ